MNEMSKNAVLDGVPEGPVEPNRPRLINELHTRIDELTENTARAVNALDEDGLAMANVLQAVLVIQGALVEAVKALTADPGNQFQSAQNASRIINEMEAAYGPDEGPEGDGVVQEPTGDQTGDT